jgi:hypothetical protein
MGGPAAGLWLPESGSALDAVPWLESFCAVRVANDDSLDFEVRRPSVIGLEGLQQLPRGWFRLGRESSLEDYRELGFPGLEPLPVDELVLSATRNRSDDHLLLGHLALFLAERFHALIDFCGLLGRRYDDAMSQREAACPAESRALVLSLPGRIWEMPYATGGEGCGFSHVGDREFLAAWLIHPDFRMIK